MTTEEDKGNTEEIVVSCSDFNFAIKDIEKVFYSLWDRFPNIPIAKYKITFEIYPDEEEDA